MTFFALAIWGSVTIFDSSSRRWEVLGSVQIAGFPFLKSTVPALVKRGVKPFVLL